ncbi:unnamed protein product [Arctogadus glacialis]
MPRGFRFAASSVPVSACALSRTETARLASDVRVPLAPCGGELKAFPPQDGECLGTRFLPVVSLGSGSCGGFLRVIQGLAAGPQSKRNMTRETEYHQ